MTATASPALIAFDLDGTLVDSTGVPRPSTAIRAALKRGTRIALDSGRDPWALRHLADASAQRFALA